ncbi:multidrug ABC transporter substrate-binding protein [Opitutaceae bacterium EW11]|nr:multidrug ABC transporter substrate-binding protein [Opitutaceae bacterium EW11]
MIARWDRWIARVRSLFRRKELDAEFAAELEHHLESLTDEFVQNGLDRKEAHRRAVLALGGITQTRELQRQVRGFAWLDQFLQDCAFAVRVFRREKAFTVTVLAVLAVGIGLNVTVFSLVNTTILRPLPFPEPERLYWISNRDGTNANTDLSSVSSLVEVWEELARTSRTMEVIEAFDPFSVRQTYRLTGAGDPETILSLNVSPGLFGTLGIRPMLGRLLLPEDAVLHAPPRILLTHQLWQRRFASDPAIVGRSVQINGAPVEVVGVMPPIDVFSSVFFPAVRVDVYSPLCNDVERGWGNTVIMLGRARPGFSSADVRADLKLAVDRLQKPLSEKYWSFSARPTPLKTRVVGSLQRPLTFLWIAAAMVLAIVGLNVGGLQLARGAARSKELAVRYALGAGRGRLLRQLVTECSLLVAVGSAVGLVLAWGLIHFLTSRSAVEMPLLQTLHLGAGSAAFTVALAFLTTLFCGLAPAWRLAQAAQLGSRIGDDGRTTTASLGRSRLRNALVVGEVALACTLAVSAALVTRSLNNVLAIDLGFQPKNLVAIRVDPGAPDPKAQFIEQLLERARSVPGVEAAGATDCIPVERDRSWWLSAPDSENPARQVGCDAHVRIVTPGLLATMGIPLHEGRDFAASDDAQHPTAIIVNRTLAKRLWPNAPSALGKEVRHGGGKAIVVGVAGDVRHSGPEVESGSEMYFCVHQLPQVASWDVLLRTRLPPALAAASLRQVVRGLDPTLPLTKVRSMQAIVDRSMSSRRLLSTMVIGFAAMALGLALFGLYGVISYTVAQRQREIGIRMALGAAASTVLRNVVGRTLALAVCGTALGVVLALAVSRSLASVLYGISPTDPTTYAVAVVLLLGCAIAAGYYPARRAAQIDPATALRWE